MTGPIVVTGASGFVGKHLVSRLLRDGHAVRALVRDPDRYRSADGVDVRPLDLAQATPETIAPHLFGATRLCHMAAFLPPSYQDPAFAEPCLRVNALGTLSLLEAACKSGVTDFVHFSSGNVYEPQNRTVTEDDPLYPSPRAPYYLASKVCGEVWVDHFRRAKGLSAAILRVASVYGPGMPKAGMVPTFTARLRAREPVTVQDGGRFRADLVHVDDVVDATVRALERRVTGAFNVGSGRDSTALEVVMALAEILGRDVSLVHVEPARPGAPPVGFSGLNIERARRMLGYSPRALRAGLESYVASAA